MRNSVDGGGGGIGENGEGGTTVAASGAGSDLPRPHGVELSNDQRVRAKLFYDDEEDPDVAAAAAIEAAEAAAAAAGGGDDAEEGEEDAEDGGDADDANASLAPAATRAEERVRLWLCDDGIVPLGRVEAALVEVTARTRAPYTMRTARHAPYLLACVQELCPSSSCHHLFSCLLSHSHTCACSFFLSLSLCGLVSMTALRLYMTGTVRAHFQGFRLGGAQGAGRRWIA